MPDGYQKNIQRITADSSLDHMQQSSDISAAILAAVAKRGAEKTTCPSEIARMMFPEDWRDHMKNVLDVAIELQNKNKVVITQKGMPVDVHHIKGPVRIGITKSD
jgi:hypothetical protein